MDSDNSKEVITTTTTASTNVDAPLKRKYRSNRTKCPHGTTYHNARGQCVQCKKSYEASIDKSGVYKCDKCEQDTIHYKNGRCKPCTSVKASLVDHSGNYACEKCGEDTDHLASGKCKQCVHAYLIDRDESGVYNCEKCGENTEHYKSGGGKKCAHDKNMTMDKAGTYFCAQCDCETIHSRFGSCKPCKDRTSRCDCGNVRANCAECTSTTKMTESGIWCIGCFSKTLSVTRRTAGIRVCATCDKSRPMRIEHVLRKPFSDAIGMPSNSLDVTIGGAGGGNDCGDIKFSRPDMTWFVIDDDFANPRIVVVEVDEQSHVSRQVECEARRLSEQFVALQAASLRKSGSAETRILFLRFNPDGYTSESIEVVAAEARNFLFEGGWKAFSPLCPHLAYFYYSNGGQKHIDYMKAQGDAVNVVRRFH